jgi:transcriptional regulator with XRE-family HTH domain
MGSVKTIGDLLRDWRRRRRLSQLDLACEAEISTRHLSFLETGRSIPSREMVLHLAEQLDVPRRERNVLLVAAGYAPIFPEHSLQDPVLHGARKAIDLVLDAQKPYPAFALDRHWNIVASNGGLPKLYDGVSPALLQQPVNALRLGLHPEGLARKIANLAEWRAHLLARLKRQVDLTGDTRLMDLLQEVSKYPSGVSKTTSPAGSVQHAVLVPLQIRIDTTLLSFFSTTTIFGSPVDVTLSELALECFYPADDATAQAVNSLSGEPEGMGDSTSQSAATDRIAS